MKLFLENKLRKLPRELLDKIVLLSQNIHYINLFGTDYIQEVYKKANKMTIIIYLMRHKIEVMSRINLHKEEEFKGKISNHYIKLEDTWIPNPYNRQVVPFYHI